MAKIAYINDFANTVEIVELVKNYLDQACEYKETDEFRMVKDGAGYKFSLSYKGYSVPDGHITIKEVCERCNNTSEVSTVIRNIIKEKANNKLINKL